MGGLDFDLNVLAILHFDGLINDIQIFPFSIKEVLQAFLVNLFLPQVACVCTRCGLSKTDLLSFTNTNQGNTRHGGSSKAIFTPNQFI